jgi:hypothetical protein
MERIHIPSFNPNNIEDDADDDHLVMEVDPSGRFERYGQCIGMGYVFMKKLN